MHSFTPANIQKFSFEFPCDQPLEIQQNGIKLFGIGGNRTQIEFKMLLIFQLVMVWFDLICFWILICFYHRWIDGQFQEIAAKNAKIDRIRVNWFSAREIRGE